MYKETVQKINLNCQCQCEVVNNPKLLQLYVLFESKNQYCQLKQSFLITLCFLPCYCQTKI
jgi:hypothetical protein